jgi:hypothetical protein
MFSSTSYAEWTKVNESVKRDNTFYVDFERIRKVDGYVYFWILRDYLKSTETGVLSGKVYNQGDCKLFRFKLLMYLFHKEPMGGGNARSEIPSGEWNYPPPNSVYETILKSVCAYAK